MALKLIKSADVPINTECTTISQLYEKLLTHLLTKEELEFRSDYEAIRALDVLFKIKIGLPEVSTQTITHQLWDFIKENVDLKDKPKRLPKGLDK